MSHEREPSSVEPDSQDEFFYQACYLAKLAAKVQGSRHSFGSYPERRKPASEGKCIQTG